MSEIKNVLESEATVISEEVKEAEKETNLKKFTNWVKAHKGTILKKVRNSIIPVGGTVVVLAATAFGIKKFVIDGSLEESMLAVVDGATEAINSDTNV